MTITIASAQLTAAIDTMGAQLTSFRTASGLELLWQADPAIWGRHAPILFPIIGRLRGGRYTVGGREYAIGQHGFARDKEFELLEQGEDYAVFQLQEDAETLAKYPFAFCLQVRYDLKGGTLTKTHTVTNRGGETMYYELGAHDGFRTTLLPGERMEDYYIQFPGQREIHPYGMNEAGHFTLPKSTYPLAGDRLPMPPRVFGLDTVTLDDLPVRRVTLANGKNPIRLTVVFDQFPYLGIWTQTRPEYTHYVCIEPWTTLPEAEFTSSALEEKPGIRALAPGQSETLAYTVTVEGTD